MAAVTGNLAGVLRRPTSLEGFWGWVTTVDAKRVGVLYGVTALIFFLVGGIEALFMRVQLASSDVDFIDPAMFNQLFTMHGTTMIFLVVMPLNAAFVNFLLPLMIGARDVAFPRLNAFSYWLFLFGAIFLNLSFITGGAPDAGWFSYANLTGTAFSTTSGLDYWILGLQILGVSTMAASFNFIVTIINMRAPGMSFMRLPIFVWMTLVISVLAILAFPVITVALIFLGLDRIAGTSFFATSGGGDPVLWQHLFWVFGHPEVYILVLPAMGMVSEVLPVFSRKPIFGYKAVVLAGVFIGVMGFGVWSHHMFSVGLGPVANSFFAASTMAIAVPTGVKIFNWLATIWRGHLVMKTAMYFALGFIAMFTIGGLSGVMHANPPSDLQQTDTYFIVAHFHYVLYGGALFGIFAGMYFWFPKITGKLLHEGLGKLHFWLFFIGGNMTFFPMHWLGMQGMPRRIYTYDSEMGFGWINGVVTLGSFIIALSILVFIINVVKSLRSGTEAGNDPWDGHTLEWTIPSPPPHYNFEQIPTVRSGRPLWDEKHPEVAEHAPPPAAAKKVEHHGHIHMPSPSYWPIFVAAGLVVAAAGFIYHNSLLLLIPLGLGTAFVSMIAWIKEPVAAETTSHH